MLQELKVAIRIHTFEKRNPTVIYPKNFHSVLATARSNSFRSDNPIAASAGGTLNTPRTNRSNSGSGSSILSRSTYSTVSNNLTRTGSFRLSRASAGGEGDDPPHTRVLDTSDDVKVNIQRGDLLSCAINELRNATSAPGPES